MATGRALIGPGIPSPIVSHTFSLQISVHPPKMFCLSADGDPTTRELAI